MIILDASALVRLVIREECSPKAVMETEKAIKAGDIVAAPDIALAEALNAIWKHFSLAKDIGRAELEGAVEQLLFIWDKITKLDTSNLAVAGVRISTANRFAVYDSLYIAASRSENAPLLTFDSDMINLADKLGITLL